MQHDKHFNRPPRKEGRGRRAAIRYMVEVQGRSEEDAKLKYDFANSLIRQHLIDRAVAAGLMETDGPADDAPRKRSLRKGKED